MIEDLQQRLEALGYAIQWHSGTWIEVMISREKERWMGRGGDEALALDDALAQMLPSFLARSGFERQEGIEAAPAEMAATQPVAETPLAPVPVVESVREQPVARDGVRRRAASQEQPPQPPPRDVPVPTEAPRPRAAPAPMRIPPVAPAMTAAMPPSSELLEARVELEELVARLVAMRPQIALMSTRLMRIHLTSACAAYRAIEDRFPKDAVVGRVGTMSRKFLFVVTGMAKSFWPGRLSVLGHAAPPASAFDDLGIRGPLPKSWAEVSQSVAQSMDGLLGAVPQVDEYGYADTPSPSDESPRVVLAECRELVEAYGGPTDGPPPAGPLLDLTPEATRSLCEAAVQLRGIRMQIRAYDPEGWGAVMGRLRWLDAQMGERTPLRRLLDAEVIPPTPAKRGPSVDEIALAQAGVADGGDAILASRDADPDNKKLIAWLGECFKAFPNNEDIADLMKGALATLVQAIPEGKMPERGQRRRLTSLKEILRADETGTSVRKAAPTPKKSPPPAPARVDPMERLAASLRQHTKGKRFLLVGNGCDVSTECGKMLDAEFVFVDADGGDTRSRAAALSVRQGQYNAVLLSEAFIPHLASNLYRSVCRESRVPLLYVYRGRVGAITMVLAQHFGVTP